jgi:hypothetical protein
VIAAVEACARANASRARSGAVAGEPELKELDEFLLARAMEHDSPTLLFRLAGEHLGRRGWSGPPGGLRRGADLRRLPVQGVADHSLDQVAGSRRRS